MGQRRTRLLRPNKRRGDPVRLAGDDRADDGAVEPGEVPRPTTSSKHGIPAHPNQGDPVKTERLRRLTPIELAERIRKVWARRAGE